MLNIIFGGDLVEVYYCDVAIATVKSLCSAYIPIKSVNTKHEYNQAKHNNNE